MLKNRKKAIEKLRTSFGKIKEDDFQFDSIERFFKHKNHTRDYHTISDKTYNDLDLEETFMFLDRTTSKVGQQYLYNKLRCIPTESDGQENREMLIERFTNDAEFRLNTQLELDKLNSANAFHISSLFQEKHDAPPKWFFIIKLLSATSISSLVLFPFIPQFIFLFVTIFIANIGVHYWNKRNLYKYFGSIPQLLKLNTIAKKFNKSGDFDTISNELSEATQAINKVQMRMSFFRLEARLQGELEALFWGIIEILMIAFLLEPLLLFGVLDRLDSKRKEIERVYSFVGEIDSLISIASLRKGLDKYCLPSITKDRTSVMEVYHPLIPKCITNSIDVCDKSILLTGSNMSGKTSFIRTIGINAITGLTLNTCFATSMSIPRLQIYSAIRISDDLLNDKSYYFEEVLSIKEMIDNSSNGKANLFLLDEIFKGTNTIERISAGKAVLSQLSKGNNTVFVSTHDTELTDLLYNEYNLYHFSEIVNDKNIDFDYKLKEGKLKNRNAIRILQINNYPESIIDEAVEIAKNLDKTLPI